MTPGTPAFEFDMDDKNFKNKVCLETHVCSLL